MHLHTCWIPALRTAVLCLAWAASSAAAAPVDTNAVAETVKANVARLVAGLNAHDANETTAFDTENIISMECGSPPSTGIESDREGFKAGFARDPDWKVSLIDETVEVAGSGDLAVYRGIYNEDNGRAGVLTTHKTNFIAEFRRQGDGTFKMAWYIVANMEPSHRK